MDKQIEWPRQFKVIEELDESQKGEYKGISWGPDNVDKIDTCNWSAMIIFDKTKIFALSIILSTEYPSKAPDFYVTNAKISLKSVKKNGHVDSSYYPSLKNWTCSSAMKDVLLEIKQSLSSCKYKSL